MDKDQHFRVQRLAPEVADELDGVIGFRRAGFQSGKTGPAPIDLIADERTADGIENKE